jgi:hypothetical protein
MPKLPMPVTERSKAQVYGLSPAVILDSNLTEKAWMFVCCVCYVLSGRGFCEGLITRQ